MFQASSLDRWWRGMGLVCLLGVYQLQCWSSLCFNPENGLLPWCFYRESFKENCFKLTKEWSRRYPSKTITDADYADVIALPANTPSQAETQRHNLERAAAGIGLHVNAHKTEYMCFNQTGDISTQNGSPLKLVDKFTYLRSSFSSIETNINMRLERSWGAVHWLSVIWKSDLTDKMKHSLF